MKILFSIGLIILFSQCTVMKEKSINLKPPIKMYSLIFDPNIDDPCGDARRVSDIYSIYDAKVKKVNDSLSIKIECHKYRFANRTVKAIFDIELAGICFSNINVNTNNTNGKVKEIIEQIILNKSIQILINGLSLKRYCIIMVNEKSLNYSLLRNGVGKFCTHEPYELDWWSECHYKEAMEIAKKEKLGIWKDK
jgi:hypothetical protein